MIKHVRTNVSQTTIRWHGVVIVRRFNYLRKQSWYMCICIYFVESTICSTRANVCVRPSPRLSFMTIPIVICSVVVFLFIVYALVHYLKERRRPTISTTSIDFRRLREERFNDSDIWKKNYTLPALTKNNHMFYFINSIKMINLFSFSVKFVYLNWNIADVILE